jgi:hypothetical protein
MYSDYFIGCVLCYMAGLAIAILYAQGRYTEAFMLLAAWS